MPAQRCLHKDAIFYCSILALLVQGTNGGEEGIYEADLVTLRDLNYCGEWIDRPRANGMGAGQKN